MTSAATSGPRAVLLTGRDASAVESLQVAADLLKSFGIAVETSVAGAGADAARLHGWSAIIVASDDGTLPAAVAAVTAAPVIRVPTESGHRRGLALLDDEGQLPAGTGVFATMAIGAAGVKNAALFVVSALALQDEGLRAAYAEYRGRQTDAVLNHPPLEL